MIVFLHMIRVQDVRDILHVISKVFEKKSIKRNYEIYEHNTLSKTNKTRRDH